MKKFLSGFVCGIGVSLAVVWGCQKLLCRVLAPLDDWTWNEENLPKPYVYHGKVVGIQFGNEVFALHDAPAQMNFNHAWDYCKKQKIGDKECCLPNVGLEKSVSAVFAALNEMLVKFGGEPLKALENNGYWAADNHLQEKSLAWIVAFCNQASDYYDRSELAYVRPVIFLEEEL